MSISLDQKQMSGSPKKVGILNGKPVMSWVTKGGLQMVITYSGTKASVLGVGPHAAIARAIAEKNEKEISWTALTKSQWVDPSHFQWLLPAYEAETQKFRSSNADD